MDLASIAVAMTSMGGMGALFAAGLAVANKKFYVDEDPRIAKILDSLPGANCGGCGLPGCSAFADRVVKGEMTINGCPVCNDDAREAIAAVMGLEATKGEKIVARIMCQGGHYESARKGNYLGLQNCTAANISGGGGKLCLYGCLGYGECVYTCPFDAMTMGSSGLPSIDEEKCTGCGNCVDACPRHVIELHHQATRVFIACRNEDNPKEARSICIKACIGCGICLRGADEGLMTLENNLARIDYQAIGEDSVIPTDKCPTAALIRMEVVPREDLLAV